MAFKGQQDSTTTPRTPESNGVSQPGPTGPQSARKQGGSRRVGSIPTKPGATPPHGVPDYRSLQEHLKGSEAGRGKNS